MSGPALLVASQPSQTVRPIAKHQGGGEGLPQGSKGFAALLGQVEELAGVAAAAAQTAPPAEPVRPVVEEPEVELPGGIMLDAEAIVSAAGRGLASDAKPAAKRLGEARGEHAKTTPSALRIQPSGEGSVSRRENAESQPFLRPASHHAQASLDDLQRQRPSRESAPKLEIADAAELRADTVQHQAARPDTSSAVVRQVSTNLQFVTRGDAERMRFDLHPEELGRVQIQLQKSGAVTRVTIVTETAQAFEALARGAQGLQQNLAQAGFQTDDLRFSYQGEREGSGRHGAFEERRDGQSRREGHQGEAEERREVVIRPALDAADRQLFL